MDVSTCIEVHLDFHVTVERIKSRPVSSEHMQRLAGRFYGVMVHYWDRTNRGHNAAFPYTPGSMLSYVTYTTVQWGDSAPVGPQPIMPYRPTSMYLCNNGQQSDCPSVPPRFSQTTHRRKMAKTKNVPLGEATPGKLTLVNSKISDGLSENLHNGASLPNGA